jgi:vitamin B12/bleomycin/antimicrobial peptide transport system ATP-binding/permease protein
MAPGTMPENEEPLVGPPRPAAAPETAQAEDDSDRERRQYLLARYWESALGFWRRGGPPMAWVWTIVMFVIASVDIVVQYQYNRWYRAMFDALDKKDTVEVVHQTLIFVPIILAVVGIAMGATYARLTTQRTWRDWLNTHVLDRWLDSGRYYQLNLMPGDHQNPEYRVAEDLRNSCDAPIEFAVGIFSAVLTAITFISVLWFIGGALTIDLGGTTLMVPGFLVIAAAIYAILASGAMAFIARRFVSVSENKNQAEAEYRFALTRLRENGESIALLGGEDEERYGLNQAFAKVVLRWREIMMEYVRTTFVSQTSRGFVPVIPILLCAPKYVAGEMSLGEVMQASSAFVIVQTAFGWLVDNYPRLADWTASARRLASLMVALDRLEKADRDGQGRIVHGESDGAALRLRNLSVTLEDGSAVVNDADVEIAPGEKVLVVGESGTGKSTLVRAISGLWPWGSGEILIQPNARLVLMPQQPYIPLGSLRRAATYPVSPDEVDAQLVADTIQEVGLGHLADRLDQEGNWDDSLSGGERQRLAFARVLLQKPDILVMDEATSALDPDSQEYVMRLILNQLPEVTLISVGHRPELEEFHLRKLVLQYQADGARLVGDESLQSTFRRSTRLLSRLFSRVDTQRAAAAPQRATSRERR